MQETITISYNNNKLIVNKNSKIKDIIAQLPMDIRKNIMGAKINNEIVDQEKVIKKDTTINFFDVNDLAGYKMYQAGLKFVLETALKETFGNDCEVFFNHSIARGIKCTIQSKSPFKKEDVSVLKERMSKIIDLDLPISKLNIQSDEAISYYNKINMPEKALNIHNITNQIILLYRLKNNINYFYVEMPAKTKCLSKFDLIYLEDNELVLLFPTPRTKNAVPEYIHYDKIIKCFTAEKQWLNKIKIPYVSDINKLISTGKSSDLIRICETNFDNQIHDIAVQAINKGAKYIMIAGPSSSGKTTTTKKLSHNLEAQGIKTFLISVDDYFLNRVDSPKNPDGSYNFECLESLDIKKLNEDLKALQNGQEVDLPRFNFITGEREYTNRKVKLEPNSIILMEGLHCLNDALTYDIDSSEKFKVYLSPFIPLNIDRHNYISTVDLRLIRRIIRDARTRGYGVSTTIKGWQSVRNGEEKYIFPFIHQADVVLNTALSYEVGALKVYIEPLLFSVTNDSPYYEEARRLIDFLKGFFPISSEYISRDSVLREFIGGSNFE